MNSLNINTDVVDGVYVKDKMVAGKVNDGATIIDVSGGIVSYPITIVNKSAYNCNVSLYVDSVHNTDFNIPIDGSAVIYCYDGNEIETSVNTENNDDVYFTNCIAYGTNCIVNQVYDSSTDTYWSTYDNERMCYLFIE